MQVLTSAVVHSMRLNEFKKLLNNKEPKGYAGVKNHGLFFHQLKSLRLFGASYFWDTAQYEHRHGRDGVVNFKKTSRQHANMSKELLKNSLRDMHNDMVGQVLKDLDIQEFPFLKDSIEKAYSHMIPDRGAGDTHVPEQSVTENSDDDIVTYRTSIRKAFSCQIHKNRVYLPKNTASVRHPLMTDDLLDNALSRQILDIRDSEDATAPVEKRQKNEKIIAAYEALLRGLLTCV